jgi:nucleoid-associated protein EbfC
MLGDLMGKMKAQNEELQKKLIETRIVDSVENEAIVVTVNGKREILDLQIDAEKLDTSDTEALQDLLMIAINRTLKKAEEWEAHESKNMVKSMIPPGMEGLLGG